MGKYASKTSVPVKNSQDEINRILSRYGAEGFGYYTRSDRSIVQFEIRTSKHSPASADHHHDARPQNHRSLR